MERRGDRVPAGRVYREVHAAEQGEFEGEGLGGGGGGGEREVREAEEERGSVQEQGG